MRGAYPIHASRSSDARRSRPRAVGPSLLVGAARGCGAAPALAQEAETRVQVNLTEAGCEPSAISVPAGPVVFEITNLGGDVGEFEILQGDFVVDEVENIVPGFQNHLVTRLDGGEYATVCYSLQSPRGHAVGDRRARRRPRPPSTLVDAATLAALPGGVRDLRPRPGARVRDAMWRRSWRPSRPGDLDAARVAVRAVPRAAGSPSSPSRSCSRTWTRPSTSGRRTSRASTTPPSRDSTASSGSCGSMAPRAT